MSKKTTEERMPAFTEEQIKILKVAFDHTSRRVYESQCDLSRMYRRLEALCDLLEEKKLVDKFEVLLKGKQGYGISMIWKPDTMDFKFDTAVRQPILEGDLSASEQCFKQEKEAWRVNYSESCKLMCGDCCERDGYMDEDVDICELASEYDGGQYLYNRKNPLDVRRAYARVQEERAKQKPNTTCRCCDTWYYSEDVEEYDRQSQKIRDEVMQRVQQGDGAAGEAAQQPKE